MKTQAVRLDEVTIRLIELLAKERGQRASDVIRTAIRDHLTQSARESESFAKDREDLRGQARAEYERELTERTGDDLEHATIAATNYSPAD